MLHKKKASEKKSYKQTKADRMDESLSMKHGKESGKKQSYASRRHESKGARGK